MVKHERILISACSNRLLQDVNRLVKTCEFLAVFTRNNAQVVASLQTSCNKAVHKLPTSCVRTACSVFVVTSLIQAVNDL